MLAGDLNHRTVRRVAQALEDSYLSIYADVNAYSLLRQGAFADAVARTAKTLFTADELAAAPPFQPVDGLREWYQPVAD